jgi:hypothetical protein
VNGNASFDEGVLTKPNQMTKLQIVEINFVKMQNNQNKSE